jgi:hypothetical protein
MPDKPTWCGHLHEAASQLRALPDPWVDRAILEDVLGIGRRRAQQVLAPCVSRQVGSNGLAHRETVIGHLEHLAAGETAHYERQRRKRLADSLEELRQARLEQPQLLVEAPLSVMRRDLDNLPAGVSISPGQITVHFETPTQALDKLLALAMAIGNDQQRFENMANAVSHTAG